MTSPISTAAASSQLSQAVSMKMTKKANDETERQGDAALELMEQAHRLAKAAGRGSAGAHRVDVTA